MASTKDIHDIMGMDGAVKKPTSKKKKKLVETQPRLSGISREVQALMGDSVPPVQIVETPKYKSKPALASKLFKSRHWEIVPFKHGARSDGLVLKHWKRANPSGKPMQTLSDTEMTNSDQEPTHQFEEEFPMEKWNVRIRVPQFTDEQYEKYFKSDDWTREETDYLMNLASEYDLRWILITDRYEPREIEPGRSATTDGAEVVKEYPPRTMEQLKLRYYEIAAQDLEMRIPKTNMTQAEFQLWEKMRNFDAKTETVRKATAEKLFERTKEDAEEERTLLEELHRITKNEEEFIAMRRDLYTRLEAAPSLRRNERGEEQNIVLSSAGLGDLLNRLFAKERAFKRRVIPNGETSTNAQASNDPRSRQSAQVHRRDTIEIQAVEKKGSVSAPIVKQLSKADEEKYGVTHAAPGERLTNGVSFRHEKINRITTAKSQVQTQKINAALTELEIPPRLFMPTEKVCKEFERLVGQIQLLLDARKTLARVSEEVKTLEEMRRQRLGASVSQKEAESNRDSTNTDKVENSSTSQVQNTSNESSHEKPIEGANDKDEGEPGPALHEDDEDAEAENEATNIEKTQVEEDEEEEEEDDDDDAVVNESATRKSHADQDEDDDAEEEEEEDEDDDEGTAALRRGAENDDGDEEDDDDEEEEEEHEPLVEEGDEDEEEEDTEPTQNRADSDEDDDDDDDDEDGEGEEDETQDVSMANVAAAEDAADADEEEEEEEEQSSRPTSAGGHKRGASVISDASGDGSNRSGTSRKRKR